LNKFELISKVAAADRTQPPYYLKARLAASLIFSARDFAIAPQSPFEKLYQKIYNPKIAYLWSL